jgi:lipopolysaccharide transport system ATP-binding protein
MEVIRAEGISKRYQLGVIDRRMLWKDLMAWGKGKRAGVVPPKSGQTDGEDSSIFWALEDISFSIKAGETVGIIGKNGAGKSTLLKILARIVTPTTGKLSIRGRVGSLLEVGTGFNPELTGRENVFLNGAILGLSREEVGKRLDAIVEFAGVAQFMDTPVKRYSSGMYARLAFSVASFLEPEILILDEVLAVGDLAFQRKCFDRMEYLIKRGHTLLFVAHDLGAVVKFCGRVLWLEKGRLKFDGPAEDGCDQYRRKELFDGADELKTAEAEGVFDHRHRKQRNGNQLWQIERVGIYDGAGKATPILKLGLGAEFRVNFVVSGRGKIELDSAIAVLAVVDEQGRRVCAFRTDYMGIELREVPEKGEWRVRLPKVPFLPGLYSLFVRLVANGETADLVQVAGRFEVADGDFYGSGKTPVRAFTPMAVDATSELVC